MFRPGTTTVTRGTSLPSTTISRGGVGAGIVGTSPRGPAFVPFNVSNLASLEARFGTVSADKFGMLAAQAWLESSSGCTFVRLLGVGDGEKRLTSGGTTSDGETIPAGGVRNSGFIVGSRLTGSNGLLDNNPFANVGGPPGRTYFLGTFMSESAGSTLFSEAGIQDSSDAMPILRGILFAASGVIPALSGNYTGNSSTASLGIAAQNFDPGFDGGSAVGSIDLSQANYTFTLLLNGHKSTTDYPNEITASLNPSTTIAGVNVYISNVLNTDPTKIREAGHCLYTYYDIEIAQARITGSGIVTPGTEFLTDEGKLYQDSVFLLTASLDRNPSDTDGSLNIPNFENFSDRYSTPKSPYVISQRLNRKNYDLFRFHTLDDGACTNSEIKVTISNLKPGNTVDEYGTFDVTIRSFENLDDNIFPLSGSEKYTNCSLNPASENYVARIIGDRHFFYDFDRATDRQRFVREGDYDNRSALVRIEVSDGVKYQTLPPNILPAGFRGPGHLVLSGSGIMSLPQHPLSDGSVITAASEWSQNIREIPVPYRTQISDNPDSTGVSKSLSLNPALCWGLQVTKVKNLKSPNKSGDIIRSIKNDKYMPQFSTARQKAYVFDNTGEVDSSGTVYDCDRYNNNLFTLENILVHTSSENDIVDNTQWAYAKYRRDRTIIPLLDSNLQVKTGVRFFDFSKDLSVSTPNEFAKFTFGFQPGFDGVNVFSEEKKSFSNLSAYFEFLDDKQGGQRGQTTGAYLSALKMLEDESETDIKVLAVPGVRVENITAKALAVAEERFDAIYVMDIEEYDEFNNVITSSQQTSDPQLTAENFRSKVFNSSFGAAYYPDVSVFDEFTGVETFVPPSIHVLRVYSRLDSQANIFAPAGSLRGTVSPPAIQLKTKFDSTQASTTSTLIEAGINPLVEDRAGIIIYSQRTLLLNEDSMLQRISFRRMLIEIRRSIREVAKNFLFEQGTQATLKDFESACKPILQRMVASYGISRYKVKIDASTTTQADLEQNVIRGQVFLQPSKSEEIVALEFST